MDAVEPLRAAPQRQPRPKRQRTKKPDDPCRQRFDAAGHRPLVQLDRVVGRKPVDRIEPARGHRVLGGILAAAWPVRVRDSREDVALEPEDAVSARDPRRHMRTVHRCRAAIARRRRIAHRQRAACGSTIRAPMFCSGWSSSPPSTPFPSPSYRVMGTGAIAYAACSMVWVFLLGNGTMVNGVIVLVIVYALTVAAMHGEWFDAGHEEPSSGTSASEGARQAASCANAPAPSAAGNAASLSGRQVSQIITSRCQTVAMERKLSPRETEIFILLAQGRTRTLIQEELVLAGKHREDPRRPHLRKARRQQPTGHDGPGARVKRRKTRPDAVACPSLAPSPSKKRAWRARGGQEGASRGSFPFLVAD